MTRKAELQHLINIFAAPAEVAGDMAEAPRWRVPLLFMILSSAVIGWFMVPAITEPMRKVFISSFGESAAEGAMKSVAVSMLATRIVIEPLFVLTRWVLYAGMLCAGAILFSGRQAKLFGKVFAFIAYSEGIFILLNLITLLVIYAKGIEAIAAPDDLTVVKGAEFFLGYDHSGDILSAMLSKITPFSAWYIVVVTLGYSALTGIGRTKVLFIATTAWIILAASEAVQSKAAVLLLSAFN